mmetsp:Transcript_2891/g.8111  ORF Transcript_2891/g.8111 Transcript_2891/m.8111 type:complete len:242 (+) Transcript_2891:421-1146(+)
MGDGAGQRGQRAVVPAAAACRRHLPGPARRHKEAHRHLPQERALRRRPGHAAAALRLPLRRRRRRAAAAARELSAGHRQDGRQEQVAVGPGAVRPEARARKDDRVLHAERRQEREGGMGPRVRKDRQPGAQRVGGERRPQHAEQGAGAGGQEGRAAEAAARAVPAQAGEDARREGGAQRHAHIEERQDQQKREEHQVAHSQQAIARNLARGRRSHDSVQGKEISIAQEERILWSTKISTNG